MKLFCSCQTRLKLELKHEFHMVIKFEECLKACHRVIIQGGGEQIEDCARIPFKHMESNIMLSEDVCHH